MKGGFKTAIPPSGRPALTPAQRKNISDTIRNRPDFLSEEGIRVHNSQLMKENA
jgi:hypothetical protein